MGRFYSLWFTRSFLCFLGITTGFSCSKKKSSGGDPAPEPEVGVTSAAQPSNNGDGGTSSPIDPTTPTSKPTNITITGTLILANDSPESMLRLTTSGSGYHVKAMTADLNPSTCIDEADNSGDYQMDCDGFLGKQLVVAVLQEQSDGSFNLISVITGLGGISDAIGGGGLALSLTVDPETGAGYGEILSQTDAAGAENKDFTVALPDALANLQITSGTYDFKKTYADDADKRSAWRNGNYTDLPDASTRASNAWAEQFYVAFTPADNTSSPPKEPRIELWRSKEKYDACQSGSSISDGTNSLSTFTYQSALKAIIDNGWAPQAAIERLRVAATQDDNNEIGWRFRDQSERSLVDSFFQRLSEEKYRHNPDQRFESIKSAYAAATTEYKNGGVSDATKVALASSWAEISWSQETRSELNLAVKKFNQTDLVNLGGTGEAFIDDKIEQLINYDYIGYLSQSIFGWDWYSATNDQYLDFAQKAKQANPDTRTSLETTLQDAITKLQNSSSSIKAQGATAIRDLLMDLSDAQNLTQTACSDTWQIDFAPIFSDSAGMAAFEAILNKVEFGSAANNWQAAIKSGVADPARTVYSDFVTTVGPILGGCAKFNLYSQMAYATGATRWNWETQQTVNQSDSDRDEASIQQLTYLGYQIQDANRRRLLFSINIRDPDGDNNALINANGGQNSSYSTSQAQDDLDALGTGIITLIQQTGSYSWLCWDLVYLGIDVSAVTECADASQAWTSSQNIYLKLFQLQDRISGLVVQEAYHSDQDFQAKMRQISAKSACIPDVWVGWEPSAGSSDNALFPVEERGPAFRIMNARLNLVPQEDGSTTFFADGSQLEQATAWNAETSEKFACVRGEVKKASYIQLDDDNNLLNFVLEQGWKDTCTSTTNSSDEYVSVYFTDASLSASQ